MSSRRLPGFLFLIDLFFFFEKERNICCYTYLCLNWLILISALTGDRTHNFGVSGQCSNQLNYPARAGCQVLHLISGDWTTIFSHLHSPSPLLFHQVAPCVDHCNPLETVASLGGPVSPGEPRSSGLQGHILP